MRRAASALALVFAAGSARAVPGPDSVAVVSNRNVPGSVALAAMYAEARAVPARQRCALDLPTDDTLSLADFRARFTEPLRRCLTEAGVDDRIEAYALMRGLPIRVTIPLAGGAQGVSLAAALMVERSRLLDGTALLDAAPGVARTCAGSPCVGARWANPFTDGAFTPGWTSELGGVRWSLRLATMLHGRSDEDAARLLHSALDAERAGRVPGTWLFMNGADRARGALDVESDEVVAALRDLGQAEVARVPFNAADTGRTLAAYVTGTASLGATIEGNRFSPGAIVDNLTSLGGDGRGGRPRRRRGAPQQLLPQPPLRGGLRRGGDARGGVPAAHALRVLAQPRARRPDGRALGAPPARHGDGRGGGGDAHRVASRDGRRRAS